MNAEEFFNQAVTKLGQGDVLGGIENFAQAIWVNPLFASIHQRFGMIAYISGNYWGAIENYTQAIQSDPDELYNYYLRAFTYYQVGEYQREIEDWDRFLNLYHRTNSYNDLISVYNLIVYNLSIVYEYRGYGHSCIGDNQRAVENFTEAIRLKPTAHLYYNRGVHNYLLGNYREAIADLTQALNLDPNWADAYYNRSNARHNIGDEQGALEDYDLAQRTDEANGNVGSDDEHGCYGRGIARSRMGDIQGAIADFQTAARICCKRRNMAFYQQVQEAIAQHQQ